MLKVIVQDIDDITDSKEILESRPHNFTIIYIYILLALVLSFFIWAFFSEKEIVIKSQGIIRPIQKIYKVNNQITGKVIILNFKNGDRVKKGDTLYVLDYSELDSEKQFIEKKLSSKKFDVENLKKLKKCILDNKNYFNKSNESEKVYYNKYLAYEKNNKINLGDEKIIKDNIRELNLKISNFELLRKSIDKNENCELNDVICKKRYKDYKASENQYIYKISKNENLYNLMKSNKDAHINEVWKELNQYKKEFYEFKNDFKSDIDSKIYELNDKVRGLKLELNKIQDNRILDKEKNQLNILVQIEEHIKTTKEELDELEKNIKQIDVNIKKCTAKASQDGFVHMEKKIKIGDLIQTGEALGDIIPSESKYKVELYIQDKDIANVKEGQPIKCKLPSLPYKEYGFIPGKLERVGVDAEINKESGLSFYTGTATIAKDKVYNHKGELEKIKNGMRCEVQVVTKKQKMLYYLLQHIRLKD